MLILQGVFGSVKGNHHEGKRLSPPWARTSREGTNWGTGARAKGGGNPGRTQDNTGRRQTARENGSRSIGSFRMTKLTSIVLLYLEDPSFETTRDHRA